MTSCWSNLLHTLIINNLPKYATHENQHLACHMMLQHDGDKGQSLLGCGTEDRDLLEEPPLGDQLEEEELYEELEE